MQVLIISGFLGAGKTTFITSLLKHSKRNIVVMENEMGAIGVDGNLLKSNLEAKDSVWELTEGCICCSMQSDFASSVLTIESSLEPDFLLVEPTGVGMLSRIVANLKTIAYDRIKLLSPITIVDGLTCRVTADNFPEIFADQVASAGTIVFSKTEHLSLDERAKLSQLVHKWSKKDVDIVFAPYDGQPYEWWDKLWLRSLNGSVAIKEIKSKPDLTMTTFQNAHLPSLAKCVFFLEDIIRGQYGNIVRAKGSFEVAGSPVRIDVVSGQYALTCADRSEGLVFIGKGLDINRLATFLEAEEVLKSRGDQI